jgi:hypothetical protein
VFAFFSVLEVIQTGLNTVSRLTFGIATQSHRAFRPLWAKSARVVPEMEIWLYSSRPTPIVRIEGRPIELALPSMSPDKRDILGFGNVRVTFVDENEDTPEKNRSRLEVTPISRTFFPFFGVFDSKIPPFKPLKY